MVIEDGVSSAASALPPSRSAAAEHDCEVCGKRTASLQPRRACVLEGWKRTFWARSPRHAVVSRQPGSCCCTVRASASFSEPFLRRALEGSERTLRREHPRTLTVVKQHGRAAACKIRASSASPGPSFAAFLKAVSGLYGATIPTRRYRQSATLCLAASMSGQVHPSPSPSFAAPSKYPNGFIRARSHRSPPRERQQHGRQLVWAAAGPGKVKESEPFFRRAVERNRSERSMGSDHVRSSA